eukprot:TRINITY_DN5065_c0_g1_i4.p1 TRINITY_DN5065_c0_g1~~TRINITY_DN5065_c0_g1_i4.p1  ORF type:complete len:228 (+),score=47.57 TRINITY_DN5065_c0_g1_i4:2-685(+)
MVSHFFFSSRRRHTRFLPVSWARRCVQETGYQRRVHGDNYQIQMIIWLLIGIFGLLYGLAPKKVQFYLFVFYAFYLTTFVLTVRAYLQSQLDMFKHFSNHVAYVLKLRFTKLAGSKDIPKDEKFMILCSHRSLGDVFSYDIILNHSVNMLSRWLVGIVFPFFYLGSRPNNACWFFKRGGRGQNLEPFFKWIDEQWNNPKTKRPNLVVFPEGHRNDTDKPLALSLIHI